MTAQTCCPEYAGVSRRGLMLGTAGVAGTAMMFGASQVATSAYAAAPAPSVLVVLSLRGAADGLSLVVPHADPVYYQARPRIGVPAERLLAKDGMFGLHPALEPLLPMWNAGTLAAVHATGLPAPNRSHFAAMEEVEDAAAGSTTRNGWLNRMIGLDATNSPLQGLNLGEAVPPTSISGPQPYMSATDLDGIKIAGADKWDIGQGRRRSLNTLWGQDTSALGATARATFQAVDEFAPVAAQPESSASYPDGDLGDALRHAARVIRADVGVQVITVDQGDWDMHTDLGNLDRGQMRLNAANLATAMAVFFADLGTMAGKVTLVTMSEFGRRVTENSNWGLDHGYGNVMFVAGAGVVGGRYYSRWPGLTTGADADLLVTTDYRSVLAEVVSTRFNADVSRVFPGFTREPVGVMRA
ncbi:DUF1501 domain-containing protein [Nocardioides sp. InS609-2]|uniref:DUF1501 domain-containing protein n=1 Tax=Nocardioides sp. InS609-2 TaxID=2760705 RepID=UPI0020BDAD6A|nr:DUF1501 domain-containing protein [Nocardioides sp. InS609-2]